MLCVLECIPFQFYQLVLQKVFCCPAILSLFFCGVFFFFSMKGMLAYKKFLSKALQKLYRGQDKILRDLRLLKESKKIGIQSLQHGNGLSLISKTLMCRKRSQFHEQQAEKNRIWLLTCIPKEQENKRQRV